MGVQANPLNPSGSANEYNPQGLYLLCTPKAQHPHRIVKSFVDQFDTLVVFHLLESGKLFVPPVLNK